MAAHPNNARTATSDSNETPSAYRIFAKNPKVPQIEAAAPTARKPTRRSLDEGEPARPTGITLVLRFFDTR
jgi:hypothetical protein